MYVYRRSWGSKKAWIEIDVIIYACVFMYTGVLGAAEGLGLKYT